MWVGGGAGRRAAGPFAAAILIWAAFAGPVAAGAAKAAVGPPTRVGTWTDVRAEIPVAGIAFDATRHVVLASVPASVHGLGNDVVELDPATGGLGRSVFVGADPGPLAVTEDGTTLYVGLLHTDRIVRVDLTSFTVASAFSTGNSRYVSPEVPRALAVVPGNDDAVVAALVDECCSPSFADFVVYDNGVARQLHDNYDTTVNSFAFGPNRSTLYGYNSEDSRFDLSTWSLDRQGLTRTADATGLVHGFGPTITYAKPYVYASYGAIVDPTTKTVVATIPANGDAVAPAPKQNRAYYVAGTTLEEYRLDTFASVSKKKLAGRPVNGTAPPQILSTNVGIAAVVGNGVLHLVGPGIGPAAPIALPKLAQHLRGLVAHTTSDLGARAIAYDPSRDRIIAAIGSAGGKYTNQIVELDPSTGTVGRHVFVGSDPRVLALSDDASTLYVGLRGSNAVIEVAMSTLSVTTSFPLGSDLTQGPYFAGSIAVQPGHPSTIAVARIIPTSIPAVVGGVAIFDDGVARQNVAGNAWAGVDSLAFGTDPATLYASDTETSKHVFNRIAVDVQGAQMDDSVAGPGGSPIVAVTGGTVVTGCTTIEGATLHMLGRFPTCVGAIDGAADRVFAIDSAAGTLSEYQLSTLRVVTTVTIPVGEPNLQLVRTPYGLAGIDSFGALTLFVPGAG